jgi:hypothetical protein
MHPFSIVADDDMPELMLLVGSVSRRQACILIGCGETRLHEFMRDGEVESYKDGGARRITLRSIVARRERLLAEELAVRQLAAEPPQREPPPSPPPSPPAPHRTQRRQPSAASAP